MGEFTLSPDGADLVVCYGYGLVNNLRPAELTRFFPT
jgi:hypothetical protein